MGREADYPIWFAHCRAAFCWLFLTTAEIRQDRHSRTHKRISLPAVLWRRIDSKTDCSNSEAPASTELDAKSESQFVAEPAT